MASSWSRRPVRACQRNRVVRGEPANGSAQVNVRPQHRTASPLQVYRDHTLADGLGDRSTQRRQQNFLYRRSACDEHRRLRLSGRWSAPTTAVRSPRWGGCVISGIGQPQGRLREFSSQKSRVSRTAGCVARAAHRSDHSRHVVVVGGSVISSPASRCANAVKMSVARISRDAVVDDHLVHGKSQVARTAVTASDMHGGQWRLASGRPAGDEFGHDVGHRRPLRRRLPAATSSGSDRVESR